MRQKHQRWPEGEVTRDLFTLASLDLAPVAVVPEATTLAELRKIFVEKHVPAIAIVDTQHGLSGIVTRTDVLSVAEDSPMTACDVMSGFVIALPNDATVECAAALMALEGISQLVVTNAYGELVGIVSALDIARHVAVRAGYVAA